MSRRAGVTATATTAAPVSPAKTGRLAKVWYRGPVQVDWDGRGEAPQPNDGDLQWWQVPRRLRDYGGGPFATADQNALWGGFLAPPCPNGCRCAQHTEGSTAAELAEYSGLSEARVYAALRSLADENAAVSRGAR